MLLKIVEEGPAYAAFLFCAETAAALLPTVRSRCVEWKVAGQPETPEMEQARGLCRVLAQYPIDPQFRGQRTKFVCNC